MNSFKKIFLMGFLFFLGMPVVTLGMNVKKLNNSKVTVYSFFNDAVYVAHNVVITKGWGEGLVKFGINTSLICLGAYAYKLYSEDKAFDDEILEDAENKNFDLKSLKKEPVGIVETIVDFGKKHSTTIAVGSVSFAAGWKLNGLLNNKN